jgi:hypothetical protein
MAHEEEARKTVSLIDELAESLGNDHKDAYRERLLVAERAVYEARGRKDSDREAPDTGELQAVAGPPWSDVAASAYRAYAASTGNKNFRGEPMPAFDDLPVSIRSAWQAAVRQAGDVLQGGSYGLDTEQRWAGWEMP